MPPVAMYWLRMIKSEYREDIEMLATKTPEMNTAVARLKQLSEDERVQMIYESQELARMDERIDPRNNSAN